MTITYAHEHPGTKLETVVGTLYAYPSWSPDDAKRAILYWCPRTLVTH